MKFKFRPGRPEDFGIKLKSSYASDTFVTQNGKYVLEENRDSNRVKSFSLLPIQNTHCFGDKRILLRFNTFENDPSLPDTLNFPVIKAYGTATLK